MGEEALRDHVRESMFAIAGFNFCDHHSLVELYDILLSTYEPEI